MKLLVAALSVLALAVPALAGPTLAEATVNAWGTMHDPMGDVLPYTLTIESGTDATCHYGPATGAVPDTVHWNKHALVWGPTADPINLHVEWVVETNVLYGYVQFYERAVDSDTYTWGDVVTTYIGATIGEPECKAQFQVGLWDSVRCWASGGVDGLLTIHAWSNVLE